MGRLANMFSTFPAAPVSKLDVNIWNFLVGADSAMAADSGVAARAVSIFKESFAMGRFNSSGSTPWKQRKYPGDGHPVLVDTGTMRDSIKWKRQEGRPGEKGVTIYTDVADYVHARRHQGTCYADVHNAESGTYTYGSWGGPSIQRQFMGHSSYLLEYMERHARDFFAGFPINVTI